MKRPSRFFSSCQAYFLLITQNKNKMKLCFFFPFLLIQLFNSQCPLRISAAEINPPDRKLINLESLPDFFLLPYHRVPNPPLHVYKHRWPIHPDPKHVWKGQLAGIEKLGYPLGSALCDHFVAEGGVVSCVNKGFCKHVLPNGSCGDNRIVCHFRLPDSNRNVIVTYLQSTCANVCYSYQYDPNLNRSTCSKWISPYA